MGSYNYYGSDIVRPRASMCTGRRVAFPVKRSRSVVGNGLPVRE